MAPCAVSGASDIMTSLSSAVSAGDATRSPSASAFARLALPA